MSKLSKAQFKAHEAAEALLQKDALTLEEREQVLHDWDPSARHVNSVAGAFFTPEGLAGDFAVMLGNMGGARVIDLCAGIGALSYAVWNFALWSADRPHITCIEKNPDYVRVGRKVLPEAEWIEADVLDLPSLDLGEFFVAISNPPFGKIKREGGKCAPNYKGGDFEYHVIDIGLTVAESGMVILPQMSAGFKYSGQPNYQRDTYGKAFDFQAAHGLHFDACSIDASIYRGEWKGTAPAVEVVSVERVVAADASDLPLFAEAMSEAA